jgi:hypothetical protein
MPSAQRLAGKGAGRERSGSANSNRTGKRPLRVRELAGIEQLPLLGERSPEQKSSGLRLFWEAACRGLCGRGLAAQQRKDLAGYVA